MINLAAFGGVVFPIAYNEVVVALIDEPGSMERLRRFAMLVAAAASAGLLVLLVPAVGALWFRGVTGLSENLAGITQRSLWFALPPRSITEAAALSLLAIGAVLFSGVAWA